MMYYLCVFFKTEGYGKVAFEKFYSQKLPLTLGRDFAGIARAVGKEVKDLKIGTVTKLWGWSRLKLVLDHMRNTLSLQITAMY